MYAFTDNILRYVNLLEIETNVILSYFSIETFSFEIISELIKDTNMLFVQGPLQKNILHGSFIREGVDSTRRKHSK